MKINRGEKRTPVSELNFYKKKKPECFVSGGVNFMSFSLFMMAQPQGGGGGWMGLLPLIIIFAIFYFLMISPMRRRQKKLQMLISNLKKGDKIVTTGGVYGTVVGIGEDRIQLRIAERVNIDIAKNAVAGLQPERR